MRIRAHEAHASAGTWGLAAGLVVLALVATTYAVVSDAGDRPLAAFVLPPLLTAVWSGWLQTVVVGVLSLATAAVVGVAGPLDGAALTLRLAIIALAIAAGAIGAWVREAQRQRLDELTESSALLRTFERSLAPAVDAPRGFDVAVRYAASERHMDIGGDFIDAVGLPDGRLAVVIGDVCGHGPSEAAYGTALRAAWRTIALTTNRPDPIEWVRRLDATFFAGDRSDAYVTMCTGIIDRRTLHASFVSAGHPWPVALGATTGVVAVPSGAPLGLGPKGWTASEVQLGPRGLLLYTDGLIENPRRDGPPDRWGEEGLVDWLQGRWPADDLGRLSDELMEAACDGREPRDDVGFVLIACTGQARTPAELAAATRRPVRRYPSVGRVAAGQRP
ncbi:MAG: PP2C family protein-serine/threonine phosphatase [Ilumatobacteraceae bacterium]